MRTSYWPRPSYLIVAVLLAVQVPFRVADSHWVRAALLTTCAVVVLVLGMVTTDRRRRAHTLDRDGPERVGQ